MESFTVPEAKSRLADIVDRVAGGEEVVLTRRGEPVARIVPVERRTNILGAGRLDPNLNEDAIARDEWWKRGR